MGIIRLLVLLLCGVLAPLGYAQANTTLKNTEYTVQNRDTLWRVARDVFGTKDFRAIARANNIADPNRIYPGMVLKYANSPTEEVGATTPKAGKVEACASDAPLAQVGVASLYDSRDGYHGKQTASGETYDMHKKTAAHPTLPFGTMVCVSNQKNGKSAVARINERGPRKHGRAINVSHRIAQELEMVTSGVATVRISTPSAPPHRMLTTARIAPVLRKAPDATHGDNVAQKSNADIVIDVSAIDPAQLDMVVRELEDIAGPPYNVLPLALTIVAKRKTPNIHPLFTATGDLATELFRLTNPPSTTKEY